MGRFVLVDYDARGVFSYHGVLEVKSTGRTLVLIMSDGVFVAFDMRHVRGIVQVDDY